MSRCRQPVAGSGERSGGGLAFRPQPRPGVWGPRGRRSWVQPDVCPPRGRPRCSFPRPSAPRPRQQRAALRATGELPRRQAAEDEVGNLTSPQVLCRWPQGRQRLLHQSPKRRVDAVGASEAAERESWCQGKPEVQGPGRAQSWRRRCWLRAAAPQDPRGGRPGPPLKRAEEHGSSQGLPFPLRPGHFLLLLRLSSQRLGGEAQVGEKGVRPRGAHPHPAAPTPPQQCR